MKFFLPLITLSALVSSMPTYQQGPIITDDDNLMERRGVYYKIEILQAHTSRFTNTVFTKITKYASDAQGYLSDSFNGEVMTVAEGEKLASTFLASHDSTREHPHHHRHHISLLGFRNRLAVFILGLAVVVAACSFLRRAHLASLKRELEQSTDESVLLEKGGPVED